MKNPKITGWKCYTKMSTIIVLLIRTTMTLTQSVICSVLRDKSAKPMSKLLAIRVCLIKVPLAHQTVDRDIQWWFHFSSVGHHTATYGEDRSVLVLGLGRWERKTIFYKWGWWMYTMMSRVAEETEIIGNTFLRLTLELIYVWSRWFIVDPDNGKFSCYYVCCSKLRMIGVKFP